MSELGLSLQKRKSDIEEARTLTLNVLVDECKARMRENGEQREATFMILRWPRSLLGTA